MRAWKTHVARMSKALQTQCHTWAHTLTHMYDLMCIHMYYRDLSFPIIAHCHIIHLIIVV